MLLLARWLITDPQIWAGFVTLAAMPPAIAVVPFSYMLGGNMVFSLIGTTGLYLAALGITPAMMLLLLGADYVNPLRLLTVLAQLIVVPLAVSRLLLSKGLAKRIAGWRDTAVTWSYFIVIFTIIGVNRQVFLTHHDILFEVVIISVIVTFGLAYIVDLAASRMHIVWLVPLPLPSLARGRLFRPVSLLCRGFFCSCGWVSTTGSWPGRPVS